MLNNKSEFHSRLLTWYHQNKRDLPWRKTNDPYLIWVSEIMLQQTQVNTVVPYYLRFIDRFPTFDCLAQASQDDVLKTWEGLGYYSRARNLQAAARQLVEEQRPMLPDNEKELKQLPGIGDYTSAAILSIAFGKPVAAVDGNIKRVFARLEKIAAPINVSSSTKVFHKLAEQLLNSDDPGSYNQALMELGALICKPSHPDCSICPVAVHCASYRSNSVSQYPVVEKKPEIPTYHIAVGVVVRDNKILITRRSEKGLLGGMWEFPGGKLEAGETPATACIREIREETALEVRTVSHLTTVKHGYSHFKIKMEVFICQYLSGNIRLSGPTDYRWVLPVELEPYAFPKANLKFIPLLKLHLATKS